MTAAMIIKFLPIIIPWVLFLASLVFSAIQTLRIKFLKRKNTEILINETKKQKDSARKIRENTIKYEKRIINAKDQIDSKSIINNISDDILSYFDKIDNN